MKKPRIEELVMSRLFPQRDIDPSEWQIYTRRNLVQEVRRETISFYGPFDCLEAQYPGLDYGTPAHRLRLSRFPSHRKLFRVFDELRLTDNEIQSLCNWEGTRRARETYETKNRVKIKDTTWNGIHDLRNKETTATVAPAYTAETMESEPGQILGNHVKSEEEIEGEDEKVRDSEEADESSEDESEDELQRSVGVDLNQRLLVATEARARGEEVAIDAEWEQWLKEAAERGDLPDSSRVFYSRLSPAAPSQTSLSSLYWGREIPEYLSEDSATLRARLPPPPHFLPLAEANSAVATAVAVQPSAYPTSAAM